MRQSSNSYDVIVVGVGTMGAAALDAFARRGVRAIGFDANSIPNRRASHHGHTRVFRLSYYEHVNYTPLLFEALDGWRSLEERSGRRLFDQCGGLYMGRRESALIRGSIEGAERHDIAYELLNSQEIRSRFRAFTIPGDYVGYYEPTAGLLFCEEAIAAAVDCARDRGAEARPNEPVIEWKANADHVYVRTASDKYFADRLVLCPGAWANKLVRDLNVEMCVTRQTLAWLSCVHADKLGPESIPCWAIECADGNAFHYGVPCNHADPGLKIGLHRPGPVVDPNDCPREFTADDDPHWEAVVRQYIPLREWAVIDRSVCFYTNSPDHHFIIDRHPRHERVTIACGFSGHGFKYMPVIGEALADLALDGRSSRSVDFLSLKRFE